MLIQRYKINSFGKRMYVNNRKYCRLVSQTICRFISRILALYIQRAGPLSPARQLSITNALDIYNEFKKNCFVKGYHA